MGFKSKLSSIRIRSNIANLSNAPDEVIRFYKVYYTMMHNVRYDATHSKGLKMLPRNQMLQRLPIALAQVKTGNTSEMLLIEIKKILCSLYRAKKITNKVYSNVIKSIQI